MTTPNAELIVSGREHAGELIRDGVFVDAGESLIALCTALAASDARVAELERVEAALITIIRNVHGHLLDDRIDAARSAP